MGPNCSRRSIKKQPHLSSLSCLMSNCCGRFGCSILSGRTSNGVCTRKTCFLLLILRFVHPLTLRPISEAKETSRGLETSVHFTETCDPDLPHLIPCVQTTDASETDMQQTQIVHEELARRDFFPQMPIVDAGYVDAGALVESRERYGIELVGPVSNNNQWQAKAGKGFDQSGLSVDFEIKEATCPQGQKSVHWLERTDQHGHPNLLIRFDLKTCRECPCRSLCTRAQNKPRLLTIRSKEEFLQLQRIRKLQGTEEFRTMYAMRSGIEGTHSEACAITRITPNPLYWPEKDCFPTLSHCCRHQSSSSR